MPQIQLNEPQENCWDHIYFSASPGCYSHINTTIDKLHSNLAIVLVLMLMIMVLLMINNYILHFSRASLFSECFS